MRISDWSSDVCSSDLAVADMETAERRDDRAAWAAGDATFHRLLVEASGNRRLVAMVEAVRDQSHRVRMLTLQLRPRPVNSNRDNAEEIGRAHVWTPVTNAQLVCPLLLEKKKLTTRHHSKHKRYMDLNYRPT